MGFLGNILWFLFGGCIAGISWFLAGLLWCITIVGIPLGLQCFKFASLSFCPFGKQIVFGGGAGSVLLNIFWLIYFIRKIIRGNFHTKIKQLNDINCQNNIVD